MTTDEAIAGTLAWCNEQRARKGLEPLTELPKGRRSAPVSCPCGDATGLWVTGSRAYEIIVDETNALFDGKYRPDMNTERDLPPAVREFVLLFDSQQLPQFEI